MSPRIAIAGTGAVSAAGWGVPVLMTALAGGAPLPVRELVRERLHGPPVATPARCVPPPGDPAVLPKNPRLRRVSPISKFAIAAALEAAGPARIARAAAGELRIGVLCTLMNGCVNYSNRFFGEVLADPSVASPILFPETVYNAPSSHISAFFHSTAPNDTLVGDSGEIFTALEIATEWLLRGDCDGCLIVAPEELDWLSAEALRLYSRGYVPSEGAAALYLELEPEPAAEGPALLAVPDPVPVVPGIDRAAALRRIACDCRATDDGATLLCDGRTGVVRYDRPEELAFAGWTGPRISTRRILGEALGASAGLQCVAAVETLRRGEARQALVVTAGGNEQVAGCLFG